ncbi:MAG: hypothetical protein ACI3XX_05255, partial [Eubacteriales bacterium]
ESTPTDTQDITDTQSESETGSNTDTESDTDTQSDTDIVADTDYENEDASVKFDDKINIKCLYLGDSWDFGTYSRATPYDYNEYKETNVLYLPENFVYSVLVEYKEPIVSFDKALNGKMADIVDKIDFSEEFYTYGVKKMITENTKVIKLDNSSIMLLYDGFYEYNKVQKEGLHALFEDGSIKKATVDVFSCDKEPTETYEMITMDGCFFRDNMEGVLLKTYNDFAYCEANYIRYNSADSEFSIDGNVFEQYDVFVTSARLHNPSGFKIMEEQYVFTDTIYYDGDDSLIADNTPTGTVKLVMIPKSEENVPLRYKTAYTTVFWHAIDTSEKTVCFDDKIFFNTYISDLFIKIPEQRPQWLVEKYDSLFTVNEYGERNLTYIPEICNYYICVEFDPQPNRGTYIPYYPAADNIIKTALTHFSAPYLKTENCKKVRINYSSVLYLYSAEEFESIQKEGLHALFGDNSVTKATVGMFSVDEDFEGYDSVCVYSDIKPSKFGNDGQLITTYDELTEFLSEYEFTLTGDKINEATFENYDVLAINAYFGSEWSKLSGFRIIDGKFYLSYTQIKTIEVQDIVTYQVSLVIVPKSDTDIGSKTKELLLFGASINIDQMSTPFDY